MSSALPRPIRLLPDRVANQIAAGEVIERPAAVVKELVENALDAGATRIEVEFRHGGRALMRIEDNGHGMDRDNALLALERHATSKIAEAADLDQLGSFGFRGEALPSIASVSKFTLQTRTIASEAGVEVLINGGRLVHVRDCGRPVGTRIEVAQLFNSVPARRKFLKTDATEAAHIIAGVRLYALAFPTVSFTLIEDGRVIFRSPECPDLLERVGEIFGRQLAESLVPLETAEAGMRLHGLIGRPGSGGRSTRHEMITFINQRPVDSRTLNYALIESYHETLPKGRYPCAFVFFEIDPAAVDVNVHPAKREVRFRSEPAVRGFVIRSILRRLRELTPESPPPTSESPPVTSPALSANPWPASPRSPAAPAPFSHLASPPRGPGSGVPSAITPSPSTGASTQPVAASPVGVPPAPVVTVPASLAGWKWLALAHGAYALYETPAGIILLDRRAAQERIWFERLSADFAAGKLESQHLLLPVPLELDPIAAALLLDRLDFFRQHGIELAEFGRNFFRIEAIPAWMEPAEAEPFVRELLGAVRDGRLPDRDVAAARDQLARLAAARAVRLYAVVTAAEMQELLRDLFACRSPHTSPAGRPTYIELGHGELNRRFQK